MKTVNQHLLLHDHGFTEIVQEHSPRLFHVAYRITKNRQIAEDIVQEAFLRLWQQRKRLTPENPGGWLYRVVSNLGMTHLKRSSHQLQLLNRLRSEKQHHYSDVEERLVKKEKEKMFNNLFNQLTQKQQEIYRLSREEGLRRNEIATLLNLSPNTVKVHLLRAVQFMKEHIAMIILFVLFFLFNNLLFQKGNTSSAYRSLDKVKESIHPPRYYQLNIGA